MQLNIDDIIYKNYLYCTNEELSKLCNVSKSTIVRHMVQMNLDRKLYYYPKKNEISKSLSILGFSKYYITSLGRVYNNKNILIKPSFTSDKYLCIKLYNDNGKRETKRLHRLVALMFIPNPDNKQEVNHKNLDKSDNSVNNLEWVSSSENLIYAYKYGARRSNKGKPMRRYTDEEIMITCKLIKKGLTNKEISDKTGFDKKWIGKVKNKKIKTELISKYIG